MKIRNIFGRWVVVALAGNQNCGKTTLFNNLTGMRQHVGNWTGKIVAIEQMDGKATYDGTTLEIVDLPLEPTA